MAFSTIECPLCDEVIEAFGPASATWALHDHLTIDHAIPAEEAERLEPD